MTGSLSDPDGGGYILDVDWGDGSAVETFTYPAGTTSFSETHQYLDDNPSGTSSDDYSIGVTLTGSGGESGSGGTGGGSLFLTGHDIVLHGHQNGYDVVVLDYLRGAGTTGAIDRADYDIGYLTKYSFRPDPGAYGSASFGTVDRRNPTSFASAADFATFLAGIDVLYIPWIYDIGTDGSSAINSYASEIADFFNAGGDIAAESSHTSSTYYNFLPPGVAAGGPSISGSSGFTATPAGVAIGIQSNMMNGYPTHNRFLPGFSPAFTVFEERSGQVISLGVRDATITDDGIGSGGLTVTVDNVAPDVTLTGPTTGVEGETETYSFSVTDVGTLDTFAVAIETCGSSATLSNSTFNATTGSGSFDCTFALGASSTSVFARIADDDTMSGGDTVDVTIIPANSPPEAEDDTATTNEDEDVDIDVLGNDFDPDGDPLAVTGITQGANGAVSINGDGTVNYNPAPNYNGPDTFEYTVSEVLPATCQEIRDADASAGDGDYEVYPNGMAFTVYCHNMSTTPADYLTLVNTGGNNNFGQYTIGGASPGGTNVRTNFNKIKIDPLTLIINIGDGTFATSTGSLVHSSSTGGTAVVNGMPLGVAMGCQWGTANGRANIDLTGTPFFVDDTFTIAGFPTGNGGPTFSPGNQVVNVTGGGYCGWTAPAGSGWSPLNLGNRYGLDLGFTGPSAPAGLSDTATVSVTVLPVNDDPTVSVTVPAVNVDEGQTAANNGGFDDIDAGDVVTVSASVGTVTQVGTRSGTWNWSYSTTDGPDNGATVTITATDSAGATATTTFGLTVNNVAPSVAADAATVAVDEGDTAVNTGTFSDPGDDVVIVTASSGTVTQAAGTWSWSFDSTDGPDESTTVTVTATDSDGASSSTTFGLTVNNVAPSVAADETAVAVDEGDTAGNAGTFSDPGADVVTITASSGTITQGAGTWSWSFDSTDGPDESTTVTVTATDSDGASSSTTFGLTVNNVAPTAEAGADQTVFRYELVSVDGTWTDPAESNDNPYAWAWDLDGDASPDSSGSASYGDTASETTSFALEGFYTLTFDVSDDDGAGSSDTVEIEVVNQAPDCSVVTPSTSEIWAPNHKFVSINVLGVTDADGDSTVITIDSIFQDEPVDSYGDGKFSPDGQGVGTDTAEVRAERSGTKKVPGDGRVYHISFTADDGHGGSCSGEVLVGVPHDKGKKSTLVDGGGLHDSTVS